MRVVLAGGSGLIGRELARELVAGGCAVEILSRRPEAVEDLAKGCTAARWDGHSTGALVPRLEGASVVINLAGENIGARRWSQAQKNRIRESRARTVEAVVGALGRVRDRPSVLVQASAVGFYGAGGDRVMDEGRPPGDGFLASVCREWEAASADVESLGVRRVLLRTGVVLSRRGGALPRILMPFRLFAGGPVGSGKQWFPWIHIRDEVRAIRFLALTEGASGPYNLAAPNPVTNRELARTIGRVINRPSVLPTPAFALKAALGEMAALVLEGQRAVPKRLLEAGFEFEFGDLEMALRDLLER